MGARERGNSNVVQTFVVVYLLVGFAICLGLAGWVLVTSVRRHGLRRAIRGGARAYFDYLPLHPRTAISAWTFVVALPLIAVWAIAKGDWDPVGAVFVALLWLAYFALLRWHQRAKARARDREQGERRRSSGGGGI